MKTISYIFPEYRILILPALKMPQNGKATNKAHRRQDIYGMEYISYRVFKIILNLVTEKQKCV